MKEEKKKRCLPHCVVSKDRVLLLKEELNGSQDEKRGTELKLRK